MEVRLSDRSLGRLGEWLAGRMIRSLGYSLWARNWSCRFGELDLIARDGRCLVAVEVKSILNSGRETVAVERRLTKAKYHRILRLMKLFCGSNPIRLSRERVKATRVDLICVRIRLWYGIPLWSIDHYQGISGYSEP